MTTEQRKALLDIASDILNDDYISDQAARRLLRHIVKRLRA